jgi:hypothetical protein
VNHRPPGSYIQPLDHQPELGWRLTRGGDQICMDAVGPNMRSGSAERFDVDAVLGE